MNEYPAEMKQNMIKALELNLGNVSLACKAMNIVRYTHYKWMKEDPEYRKAVKDMENAALDFAESALMKQIAKGNPLSTIFFLKCKGKKRGYIEQNNLEIKEFWETREKNGIVTPVIQLDKLERFLNEKGGFSLYFYDPNSVIYRLIRIQDGMVEESSTEQIKKFIKGFINRLPSSFDMGLDPQT